MEMPTFDLVSILMQFADKYPWLASVFFVIGGLRVVFKPLMALVEAYVAYTPSKDDDTTLAKVKASKAYTWLAFGLDYVASIKLPTNKKNA